jgi:hypothetical protein
MFCASVMPPTEASMAPPFPVIVPVPKDSALSKIAVPPLSMAEPLTKAPCNVQVPLLTTRFSKLRYCSAETLPVPPLPEPGGLTVFCSTSVSVPPMPASTVPVAAKVSRPGRQRGRRNQPGSGNAPYRSTIRSLQREGVVADGRAQRDAAVDRARVDEGVAAAVGLAKATRPVIVPVFVKLTLPPP